MVLNWGLGHFHLVLRNNYLVLIYMRWSFLRSKKVSNLCSIEAEVQREVVEVPQGVIEKVAEKMAEKIEAVQIFFEV
jgi:hypothetical protein